MTVAEFIESREDDWKELERLNAELGKPAFFRKREPEKIARFASLYRSVCGDLALASTYRLPAETVRRLNDLIGLAHRRLYRRRPFDGKNFARICLFDAPRWLLTDVAFWVALALFWGPFLVCAATGRANPDFARKVLGPERAESLESTYSEEIDADDPIDRIGTSAFYIRHNGGIGLQCFALGTLGAAPGIFILLFNSIALGAAFGLMGSSAVSPDVAARFAEFTTAHGPFELTAIVMSAAAGMRIGFGAIRTGGYSRVDSIRRAAVKAAPTIFAAFLLFAAAAFLEAFVSPHSMSGLETLGFDSFAVKRGIARVSTALLVLYIGGLGGLSLGRRIRTNRRQAAETTELAQTAKIGKKGKAR